MHLDAKGARLPLHLDPHEPGWLSRWLRHAFIADDLGDLDVDAALDAWLQTSPDAPGVGSRALIAWLCRLRLAAPRSADARLDALRFALALSWLADCTAATAPIVAAIQRHERGVVEGTTSKRGLDAALDALGRTLAVRVADGVEGWLAAATLATVAAAEARAMSRLLVLAARDSIDPAAIAEMTANIETDRLAILEALIGVVRADQVVDNRERRLLEVAARAVGTQPGKARVIWQLVHGGGEDLDCIATALPSPKERRRLLLLLELTALADGEVDQRETAWIHAVEAALGTSEQEGLAAHAELLAHAQATQAMTGALGQVPLADAASRRVERRIRGVLRVHGRAIRKEIQETGELLALLGAATQRPLTDEESATMRKQLLDLCRSVPALAIFAAPGGALLLPILIRVLPFSLTPSSFQDDGL